jgi:hypothetical protein
MAFAHRLALLILPSFFLLELPARADEIHIGTGPVCDTRQQAERFVTLYDGDAQTTASAVNAEEHNPTACAIVTMVYVPGTPLATTRNKDVTFQIVQVLVVGIVTAEGVQAVEPAHVFSVLEIEERDA